MNKNADRNRSNKLVLLLALLLSPAIAFCQGGTLAWQKQYGNPQQAERCNQLVRLSPTRFAHGGESFDPAANVVYPYVLLTNEHGDSLSSKLFTSIPHARINAMAASDDGSFVGLGMGRDSLNDYANFFFKADSLGNLLWYRFYNQGNYPSNFAYKALSLPDGYLLSATRLTQPANPTWNIQQLSLIKTDLQGTLQWQKTYGTYTEAVDIIPTENGGYLAMGYKLNPNASSVYYSSDLWLLKLTPAGDTLQTYRIGSPLDMEMGYAICQTADKGFAIAGAYRQNISGSHEQGYVVKVDNNFQKLWDVKLPAQRNADFYSAQATINNGVVVAGRWQAQNYFSKAYVAGISGSGTPSWAQLYDTVYTGSAKVFNSLLLEQGSAYLSGVRIYSTNPGLSTDNYLVKLTNLPLPYRPTYCATPPTAGFSWSWNAATQTLHLTDTSRTHLPYDVLSRWRFSFGDGTDTTLYDPNGLYNSPPPQLQHYYGQTAQQLFGTPVTLTVTNNLFCTDTFTVYPWGKPLGTAALQPHLQVKLHPNPATGSTMLEFSQLLSQAELRLFHPDGRLLQRQQVSGRSARLELQALPPGLYLWQLHSKQGVQTGKVVRQ